MNKGLFFTALTCGALIGAAVVGSSRKAYDAVNKGKTALANKAEEMLHKSDLCEEAGQTEQPF